MKPGFRENRNFYDEKMLRLIGNPKEIFNLDSSQEKKQSIKKNVHVYDARPYINAFGNKVHGAGFESIQIYKNCEIFFLQIENIHFVRESYKKICIACQQ